MMKTFIKYLKFNIYDKVYSKNKITISKITN